MLEFPAGNLITNCVANVVLGQPNFVTNTVNTGGENSNTLKLPFGLDFDPSGNLWVSDYGNNRVLEFASGNLIALGIPSNLITNGQAVAVIGQAGSFTTATANKGGINANTLSSPFGVLFDSSGNLWTTDYSNNRILGYLSVVVVSPISPSNPTVASARPSP